MNQQKIKHSILHKNSQFTLMLLFIFACYNLTQAQTLKADYQFQGNLNSSVAGAPAMTNLTGSNGANSFRTDEVDGYTRQVLHFPLNSGLAVNTSGVIPNNAYTIVILFKFDEISGYRRVASFDNRTTDNGAYMLDGRLEFESTNNAPIFPDTYIQVVIVREASGVVRAYRDGGFRVNVNDGGAFAISAANILSFFQDDPLPPTEASEGSVARIRLYDAPMTTTQVRALDRLPNANGGEQPILFTSARDGINEIYTMNADGSNQRRLTNNEVVEFSTKWSPNRQKIVYQRRETSTSPYQIWIMNADGSGQTRLTNSPTIDQSPTWKPDGSKILFSRCDSNSVCDLYTMNPDGSAQAALPMVNTPNDEDLASYSPDGSKIVFVCSINTTSFANENICMANADGSNRQQLTNTTSPVANQAPRFSPDGTKIAFHRLSNVADVFTSNIFIMNSNGSNQTNLTNTSSVFNEYPVWSADGTKLAFASQRESVYTEIYTINVPGGDILTRLTINSVGEIPYDWYRPQTARKTLFDFDGDGKADVSVFRPESGVWYLNQSSSGFAGVQFGVSTDKLVPADYDGDGKTDVAVFRNGDWYLQRSQAGFFGMQFGFSDDIAVPADFDGDGKAEIAVYRPSNGTWYLWNLSTNQFSAFQFGAIEDKPVTGDFDGDGKSDYAVYRPSSGSWYIQQSTNGFTGVQFGAMEDKPVAADYDGDGKTDIAVFRPSNGAWYRLNSSNQQFFGMLFGFGTDLPIPADYDGDGKTDIAVFRSGNWYIQQSASGFTGMAFGFGSDKPIPNVFIP